MRKFKVFTNLFKKRPSIKRIIGFSLVELMISLITISCIAAAFAPVITKKLNKSAVAVKSGNQLLSDCSKWGSACKACYPGQCIVCTLTCRDNQWLNPDKCTCNNCSDVKTDCIACHSGFCDKCKAGKYITGAGTTSAVCNKCADGKCCPEGATASYNCEGHYQNASLLN